jgi:hypothetical protein
LVTSKKSVHEMAILARWDFWVKNWCTAHASCTPQRIQFVKDLWNHRTQFCWNPTGVSWYPPLFYDFYVCIRIEPYSFLLNASC